MVVENRRLLITASSMVNTNKSYSKGVILALTFRRNVVTQFLQLSHKKAVQVVSVGVKAPR